MKVRSFAQHSQPSQAKQNQNELAIIDAEFTAINTVDNSQDPKSPHDLISEAYESQPKAPKQVETVQEESTDVRPKQLKRRLTPFVLPTVITLISLAISLNAKGHNVTRNTVDTGNTGTGNTEAITGTRGYTYA